MPSKLFKTKKFLNIYTTQAFFSASSIFGWTFVYLYLFLKGFSYFELGVFTVLIYATPFLVLLKKRKVFLSISMKQGIFIKMLTFASVAFADSMLALILCAIFLGISRVFFWVPYNVALLSLGTNRAGLLSSLAFALPTVFGIVLPALGGIVAEAFSFEVVFALSIVILFGSLFATNRIKEKTIINFDGIVSWRKTTGIKTLMMIHGAWQGINWTALPLITIYFLESATAYGAFFAYLGLVGAISSVFLGHSTDKNNNRKKVLYPATIGLGITTIISGFAGGLIFWAAARGFVSFFDNLCAPFTFSVVVDNHKDLQQSFIANEMSIAAGRTLGAVVVLLSIAVGNIYFSLIFAGLLYLMFPLVLKKKKIYA